MLLYLQIDDYLRQWFVDQNGGSVPVKLPKGSPEASVLFYFLKCPPEGYVPEKPAENDLPIVIPQFKGKDTRYCFFLPETAKDVLREMIRTRFDLDMWSVLSKMVLQFKRLDKAIDAFMESRGIELTEKNWNAVNKRFQRKRDIYRRIKSRKSKK